MAKTPLNRRGTGILILALVFLILLTLLYIIEEINKKTAVKPPVATREKKISTEKKTELPEFVLGKKQGHGRIAIILDDVGWNPDIIGKIKKIDVPLTLSILPDSPFGLKIAQQMSGEKNVDIFLHIPLEPESSMTETNLAQNFLTTKMSNKQIEEKIDDYFARFGPYITGVNNHMGSKFTTDREKMEILLRKIKEQKLVYVDSLTSKKSVGYTLAREMGVPSTKRDIFLDNSSEYSEISRNLEEAAKIAEQKGVVVAIGHARTNTLKVLEEKIPELKKQGYQFIPISEAIK